MIKTRIKLSSVDDIKEFVSVVAKQTYNIELISGKCSIDAKSLMGIFSFDTQEPIDLVAHTDDASDFFAAIAKFIVG